MTKRVFRSVLFALGITCFSLALTPREPGLRQTISLVASGLVALFAGISVAATVMADRARGRIEFRRQFVDMGLDEIWKRYGGRDLSGLSDAELRGLRAELLERQQRLREPKELQ